MGRTGAKKPGKVEQAAAREERLAQALRENMKRRKAQARSRAAAEDNQEMPIKDAGTPAKDTGAG